MLLRWLQPALLAASLAAITTASFAADSAPFPSPAPVVYVADFDLDVANVKPDSGPGSRLRRLGSALPSGPLRSSKDPQTHAKEIVADMADDLTDDLKKAGVDARRIAPGQPAPTSGWQVRGVFLSVDEGNRLQRADGRIWVRVRTDFQVAVSLDDLSTPNLPPLYQQHRGGDEQGQTWRRHQTQSLRDCREVRDGRTGRESGDQKHRQGNLRGCGGEAEGEARSDAAVA